jgi:hypothetical protein
MLTCRSENERRPAGPKTSPPPTWQEHSFGSSCRNPVSTVIVMLKHTGSILIILRSFTLTLPDVSQPIQVTPLASSIDQREFGDLIAVSRRAVCHIPSLSISFLLHSSSILSILITLLQPSANKAKRSMRNPKAYIPKIPSRNHQGLFFIRKEQSVDR